MQDGGGGGQLPCYRPRGGGEGNMDDGEQGGENVGIIVLSGRQNNCLFRETKSILGMRNVLNSKERKV